MSFGAIRDGVLDAQLVEQIAVAVAERHGGEYCLALHAALGRKAGASAEEMRAAQDGRSANPKSAAALHFALKLTEDRGHVGAAAIVQLHAAGFGDEEMVEILAHVALNLFTNYVNVAFAVPVDVAAVPLRTAA